MKVYQGYRSNRIGTVDTLEEATAIALQHFTERYKGDPVVHTFPSGITIKGGSIAVIYSIEG